MTRAYRWQQNIKIAYELLQIPQRRRKGIALWVIVCFQPDVMNLVVKYYVVRVSLLQPLFGLAKR